MCSWKDHLKGCQQEHTASISTRWACVPRPSDAAGGHYNPSNWQHRFNNLHGVHAGDLRNLEIGADGRGTYRSITDRITLAPGAANTVYDADGTSLMMHATADDYRTDPSGNSGGRIACGVGGPGTALAGYRRQQCSGVAVAGGNGVCAAWQQHAAAPRTKR